jgi:glycosyltransferase involved in cell wall biosynthesis
MRKPIVSLCIPTHDRQDKLSFAIKDLLNQKCVLPFEVVVSDNSTLDAEANKRIVKSFKDNRLRYCRFTGGDKQVDNFNNCLKISRGDYVAIFHDDNRYDAKTIANLLCPLLMNDEVAASSCAVMNVNMVDGTKTVRMNTFPEYVSPEAYLESYVQCLGHTNNLILTPTLMLRKSAALKIGGFPTDWQSLFDGEFDFRLAQAGYWFAYTNKPLITNQIYPDNGSHHHPEIMFRETYELRQKIFDLYPDFKKKYYKRFLAETRRSARIIYARKRVLGDLDGYYYFIMFMELKGLTQISDRILCWLPVWTTEAILRIGMILHGKKFNGEITE